MGENWINRTTFNYRINIRNNGREAYVYWASGTPTDRPMGATGRLIDMSNAQSALLCGVFDGPGGLFYSQVLSNGQN